MKKPFIILSFSFFALVVFFSGALASRAAITFNSSSTKVFSKATVVTSTITVGNFATPAFVQNASNTIEENGSSYTSISAQFTGNVTTGNTIVVAVAFSSGSDITGCRDTNNATSTYKEAIAYATNSAKGLYLDIWYATNVTGGTTPTVTCAFGSSASYNDIAIQEYSGIASTNPVDATSTSNTGSGASTAWTTGSGVTTQSNELIFGAFQGNSGSQIISPGTGFSTRTQNGVQGNFMTEDEVQSSAGSIAATASTAVSDNQVNAMVTFKPATSGTQGTNEMLVIGVAASGTAPTAVTVDGSAATKAIAASSSLQNAALWYFPGLTTGPHTVSSTLGAAASGTLIAASYFGVAQTSALDATSSAAASSKTPSSSITTYAANDLVMDMVAFSGSDSYSAVGAGQTLISASGSTYEKGGASYKIVPTAATTSTSWTLTSSNVPWQEVQAAFKAAISTTTYIWTNGGGDNNWFTATNWSGGVVPGAANIAIFSASSTANCTVNGAVSVAGIQITSGYTGTITQGSNAITVGTSSYSQAAGIFTGDSGAITMNGAFQLSGGTFTSTNNVLQIAASSTFSGGTFNNTTGTVVLAPSGSTSVVTGSMAFNNLQIGNQTNTTLTIATGTTLTVGGYFYENTHNTYTQLLGGGAINVQGNVEAGYSPQSATGTVAIALNGTSTQIIGDDSVAGNGYGNDSVSLPDLTVNKTAGVAYLEGTLLVSGPSTISNGEFQIATGTVASTFDAAGAITISSGARLSGYPASATSTLALGGGLTNAGTVFFEGDGTGCSSPLPNYIVISAYATTTAQSWSGTGNFFIRYASVGNQTTPSGGPTITVMNGTDQGTNNSGGGHWTFVSTARPQLVQSVSALSASASSLALPAFGFYPAAGDLMVVAVSARSQSIMAPTDNASNTYTLVASTTFNTSNYLSLYYAKNINTTSSFVITAHGGGTDPISAAAFEYIGIAPSSSFDTYAANVDNNGGATSLTSQFATGHSANEVYFGAMALAASTTASAGTGWTSELNLTNNNTDQSLYTEDIATSSTMTSAATWTSATSTKYGAIIGVFRSPYANGYSPSGTLDSATFDTKLTSGAQLNSVMWSGSPLPSGTQVGFQFAVSNSSSGPWNFIGPSGDGSQFFGLGTGPGIVIPLVTNLNSQGGYSLFSGYRYFRYRIELVSDPTYQYTPTVTGVNINWSP